MTPGHQNRIRIAGTVALACALLAGCEVSIKFPPISEAAEQRARSVKAKKIVEEALVDGRCKDALAVAREVNDEKLVERARNGCTQDRWTQSAPAPGTLDELGPAQALVADRHADWRRPPAVDVVQFFYPADAMRKEITGRVIVACEISEAGISQNCRLVSETPAGQGFGEAALKLAPLFEFTPAISKGRAVVETVQIPITFKLN
jgi:TonB family protein